jgi:hypothetical protein
MYHCRYVLLMLVLASFGCPSGPSGSSGGVDGGAGDAVDGGDRSPDVSERDDVRSTDVGEADGGDDRDCEAGERRCGGACVDTSTSVEHCGGCGQSCEAPAQASVSGCGEGDCQYSCEEGWRDANGDLGESGSDGCEARSCEETNGGVEVCDGADNDCDGDTDEVCPAGTTLVGGENTDRINAVASASSGIYFGGTTSGPLEGESVSGNFDGFVGRLADDGTIDWIRVFGADGAERIDDLAVGPDGGVYALGSGDSAFGGGEYNGQGDALLVKFDASGNRQWVTFAGTDTVDFGRAVDVLADGRVAVGYQTRDPFGDAGSQGKVAVFSPQGDPEFSRTIGDDVRAVAAGPGGGFAVGGEVSGGFSHDDTDGRGEGDGFVAVLDSNGDRQWARLVGGSKADTVHGVAYDQPSVYATGATGSAVAGNSPDGQDGFVARIDGADDRVWVEYFGGPGEDAGRSIEVTDDAELFAVGTVAGEFAGETVAGESDVSLLNLEGDGMRAGYRLYGGPAADMGRSISVGPDASFIGGRTEGDFEGEPHIGGVDGFVVQVR